MSEYPPQGDGKLAKAGAKLYMSVGELQFQVLLEIDARVVDLHRTRRQIAEKERDKILAKIQKLDKFTKSVYKQAFNFLEHLAGESEGGSHIKEVVRIR